MDTRRRSLVPFRPCYSVKSGGGRTEIQFRGDTLYQYSGGYSYVQPAPSRSREHFAYFVRFEVEPRVPPAVYVKTREMGQPVKVADVPFYTTLVAWIEDTSSLRKD